MQVDDIKEAMKDLQEHNIRALNPEPKVKMKILKKCNSLFSYITFATKQFSEFRF